MNLRYGGGPEDWIVRGGRPALVLGANMMPSYEHEDGGLAIMTVMILQCLSLSVMAFPRDYGVTATVAPEGPVPLHFPTAGAHEWWVWRPVLYKWRAEGWWQGLGSQQELAYRFGLNEIHHEVYDDTGDLGQMVVSEKRAEALLVSQLSPQQRLEFAALGKFRVVGARTGNHYRVTPSNGFELINAHTGDVVISYCLHTEHWLPTCDQALAVKMALEDRELEVDVLEGARPYPRSDRRRVTLSDQAALRLEREHGLLPRHRELETP